MVARTRRRIVLIALCVAAWLLLPAGVAFAQEVEEPAGIDLTGCSGSGTSTDADGQPLHSVTAPGGPGSSKDNPFVVDYDGEVVWAGETNNVITDHSWDVKIFGITVKSGGSANEDEETKDDGVEKVSDYLPFDVTGLYYVSGGISGDGGSCDGNMWVKLTGSPIGTIPWFAGLLLTALGLFGLYKSLPTVVAAGASTAAAPPPPEEE